jgi:predicted transcriptional regulator
LKEEQFKVLKTMSETTTRMDLNMFAQKVNLTPAQTLQQVQELATNGFLQRVGGGYGMTEKGKTVLKAFSSVPEGLGFHFYFGVGQPSGHISQSLEEFYRSIEQITADSLEFHLYRGDFENWLKDVCKDPELAKDIGNLKVDGMKGEDLRERLLEVLDAKYGIRELS